MRPAKAWPTKETVCCVLKICQLLMRARGLTERGPTLVVKAQLPLVSATKSTSRWTRKKLAACGRRPLFSPANHRKAKVRWMLWVNQARSERRPHQLTAHRMHCTQHGFEPKQPYSSPSTWYTVQCIVPRRESTRLAFVVLSRFIFFYYTFEARIFLCL